MSEIKLLPCPFCGGEVEMAVDSVDAYSNAYTFCCDNCYMYTAYQFSNEKEAIEYWNTRKPMERILTRLEECEKDCRQYKYMTDFQAQANAYLKAQEIIKEEGGIE